MLKHFQSFLHGNTTTDVYFTILSNCSCVTNVTMVIGYDDAHY